MDIVARARSVLESALQRSLGAELVDPDDPTGGLRFPVTGPALTLAGTLHGAALAVAIETAGYLAVMPTLAEDQHAVTNTISTQYLRAARAGEWVHVRGTLDRRSRTLAFVSVLSHLGGPDGDLVAQTQITKSVIALQR
jgi:uncharacterized protein (TIGR00369 family)